MKAVNQSSMQSQPLLHTCHNTSGLQAPSKSDAPVSTHAGSCICQTLCVLALQEVAIGLAVLGAALPAEGNHDSLLGAYVTLCSDRVWAVRKACADILPEIAKLAKAETRETQLLPVFDKFCEDVSHWVQTSALQQLGPFISTLEAHHIPQSESDLLLIAFTCSSAPTKKKK